MRPQRATHFETAGAELRDPRGRGNNVGERSCALFRTYPPVVCQSYVRPSQ